MLSCIVCVIFWETATIFHGGYVFFQPGTILYSLQQWTRVPVSLHPCQQVIFWGLFFFFCFVVFHEVLYHCNVNMFPRLVILRLYQVLFGHLCIIFFGETCIQVFCPPLLFFWPCYVACKIFVPQAGIKPVPPALGARSVNHWMDREVPSFAHLKIIFYF